MEKIYVETVESDGNSLFRSLALLLFQNEGKYKNLRQRTVEFVYNNWARFESLVQSTKDEYKSHMSRDGVQGGNVEIAAVCDMYKVVVKIYIVRNGDIVKPPTFITGDAESAHSISLLYSGCHYNAVLPQCYEGLLKKSEREREARLKRYRDYYKVTRSKESCDQRENRLVREKSKRLQEGVAQREARLQKRRQNYKIERQQESNEQRELRLVRDRRKRLQESAVRKEERLEKKKQNYALKRRRELTDQRKLRQRNKRLQEKEGQKRKRNCGLEKSCEQQESRLRRRRGLGRKRSKGHTELRTEDTVELERDIETVVLCSPLHNTALKCEDMAAHERSQESNNYEGPLVYVTDVGQFEEDPLYLEDNNAVVKVEHDQDTDPLEVSDNEETELETSALEDVSTCGTNIQLREESLQTCR